MRGHISTSKSAPTSSNASPPKFFKCKSQWPDQFPANKWHKLSCFHPFWGFTNLSGLSKLYPLYRRHHLCMLITYPLKTQSTTTAEKKQGCEHKQNTKSVTKWMKTDRAENLDWLCRPHSISCRSLRNFHIWLFKTSGFINLSLTSSFTNKDFLKSHPLPPYTDSG